MTLIKENNQSTYRSWVIGLLSIVALGISTELTERFATRRAEVDFREQMYEYMIKDIKHNLKIDYRLEELEKHAKKTQEDISNIQHNESISHQRWLNQQEDKKNNND